MYLYSMTQTDQQSDKYVQYLCWTRTTVIAGKALAKWLEKVIPEIMYTCIHTQTYLHPVGNPSVLRQLSEKKLSLS